MRSPSQLEQQCDKGFVSTVASVRSGASAGCERGAAAPVGMHCSGGIVCKCSPTDVMNCGYCHVSGHMEELVDKTVVCCGPYYEA